MKKIFLLALLIMLMCVSCGVASAMKAETTDITKKMLDLTGNFANPIYSRNLEMSKSAYAECRAAYDALYSYLEAYKPKKDESGHIIEFLHDDDRTVVYYAASIIVLRMYALNAYILAKEALNGGDKTRYKEMVDVCSRYLTSEVDYRQKFKNRYGY